MAEYDFHFTAEVMDGIFGEVIEARGAWDTLGERLDNIEQGAGGDTYTKAEVDTMLAEKVEKVTGKGLSTNDFTNADKKQITTNKNGIVALANVGAKNILNLNTNFATLTTKGITFTDNHNGTINVDGTSTVSNAYIQLYDIDSDSLFGFKIGETVVITSTSDTVQLQIVPKKAGGYESTVGGTKSAPATYTIPSTFTGFLLRVTVSSNGTHVDNEDVGGMICPKALYDIDSSYQPYAPTNRELYEMILALQSGT